MGQAVSGKSFEIPARLCAVVLLFWAHSVQAQEVQCVDGECTDINATQVAGITGSFVGNDGVSAVQSPDTFAALEQQGWREFQFLALVPVLMSAELTGEPEEFTPRLSLHVSDDGETFQPLAPDMVVQRDQVVSVILSQARKDLGDDKEAFRPFDFHMSVLARRVLRKDQLAPFTNVPAMSALPGSGLGCAALGCNEAVVSTTSPLVDGDARPDAEFADPPATASAPNELARELQTELARVGCYDITIDGLWGPGSRSAMIAFNTAAGQDLNTSRPSARALTTVARADAPVCK